MGGFVRFLSNIAGIVTREKIRENASVREKENPLVPRITPQQRDLEFVYLSSRSGKMLKVLDLA